MYFKGQKLNCSADKWLLQLIIIYDSIKINAMKHLCVSLLIQWLPTQALDPSKWSQYKLSLE